jgi:hypothetical protein
MDLKLISLVGWFAMIFSSAAFLKSRKNDRLPARNILLFSRPNPTLGA